MISCVIVDDEPLALDMLESYIGHCPQLQLTGRCRNALEAFDVLHNGQVDLLLLDIKLPSVNGLDFIRSLKQPPAIIFITAYAEHAVTGFELDAVDYLLKPVTFERFKKGVDKFLKIRQQNEEVVKDYTYFRVAGSLIKVMHKDLLVAQSVKDYIYLKTSKGNYLTHMTMKYLEDMLPAEIFIRVHRSYLVNRSAISRVGRKQLLIGGEHIPIGENYRLNLNSLG